MGLAQVGALLFLVASLAFVARCYFLNHEEGKVGGCPGEDNPEYITLDAYLSSLKLELLT